MGGSTVNVRWSVVVVDVDVVVVVVVVVVDESLCIPSAPFAAFGLVKM